jgi:hypothetical protein
MNKGKSSEFSHEALLYSQHGSALQWNFSNESFSNELTASFVYRRFGEEEQLTNDYEKICGFKELAEFSDIRKTFQLKNNSTFYHGENSQFNIGLSLERRFFSLRERANSLTDPRYRKVDYTIITDDILQNYISQTGDDSSFAVGDTMVTFGRLNQAPVVEQTKSGDRIGGYLNYLFRTDGLKCGIGVRGDYYTLVHKPGISPRASVSYDVGQIGAISSDKCIVSVRKVISSGMTGSLYMPTRTVRILSAHLY